MELIPTQRALEKGDEWALGLLSIRIAKLRTGLPEGKFDTAHLAEMHKNLFSGFSVDAGLLVTDRESKTLQGGVVDWLKTKPSKSEFSDGLTTVMGELERGPMFKLGDATVKREFVIALANATGYALAMQKLKPGEWLKAKEHLQHGNPAQMKALVEKAVTPSRAIAFETLSREKASAKFPELAGTYSFLDLLSKSMENVAGPVKGQIMKGAVDKLAATLHMGHIPKTAQSLSKEPVQRPPTPRF
jgi:hypothetical protein